MDKTLVLKPRVSEKAYGLNQARNVYVFDVTRAASKQSIAAAVQAQFGVTVTAVNVSNLKGKAKRTVRKGGRPVAGKQNDVKKAYVTVKAGDHIAIFKSDEEDAKPAKAKKEKK